MATKKQYAGPELYEKKLARVMERMGATWYNYDWTRHMAYVEFRLKGQLYRFDHSVEKAQARGFDLTYGSDVFAQLVISLEDLARMAERGIYELTTWLEGMKFLPPPVVVPEFFRVLGFESIPASVDDIKARFKSLAKQAHPDGGGSNSAFIALQEATKQAIEYLEKQ
ncbi:MAG: J domain-containing protein [Christensenellaceae bacterium]|nr:J domain-containing protein [Christensenellaceae bacterium]